MDSLAVSKPNSDLMATAEPYQGFKILKPDCSKLTTSLVNGSLKFQTLISETCQYFCCKNVRSFCGAKASHIFQQKYQCIWL